MSNVIIFCFAGRRPNMELQLPYIRRILDEHPNVEYHVWNLARDHDDNLFLRGLAGDRVHVFNHLYGVDPWRRFNDVYAHYADAAYADHLFVKLDDDVVFLETDGFGAFVEAIEANRDSVTSAQVVNNGACTALQPALADGLRALSIPLLDVHQSADYALMCHRWLVDHWHEAVGQAVDVVPIDDWLSINVIGYDGAMAQRFAALLGTPSPRRIAGRMFRIRATLGDEGMVNTLPRKVCKGFLAAHLSFGPQAKARTERRWNQIRAEYAEIIPEYFEYSDARAIVST